MADFHLAIPVRTFAIAAPKINRDIRTARRLEPGTRAAQPPHSKPITLPVPHSSRYPLPATYPTLGTCFDPAVARHFGNLAHNTPPVT